MIYPKGQHFLIFFFIAICASLNGQVTLLDEDFDSLTPGTNDIPPSWSQTNEGTSDNSCSHGVTNCTDWQAENNRTRGGSNLSGSTGPSSDHTSGSGNYMYVEASNNSNATVEMETPAIDLLGNSGELRFWVHNFNGYGSPSNHELHIDIIDASSSTTIGTSLITVTEQFVNSNWTERIVDISAFANSGNIRIKFRWDRGDNNDYRCDISVDDVTITREENTYISCFPFDGNANDTIGTNNGTLSGGPSFSIAVFEDGIDLDGVDDMVTIAHSGDLAPTEFTATIWIQAPASFTAGQEVIFENDRLGSDWFGLYKNSSTDQFLFRMGGSTAIFGPILDISTYYHIAIVYSSGTAEFYVNGNSVGTLSSLTDLTGSAATLTLGNNGISEAYEGSLDEFKITNVALSSAEVSAEMFSSCSGVEITEICFNNIDDDNDGMIDEIDPDCCDPLGTGEAYFPAGDAIALGNNSFQVTADAGSESGALWYKARANLAFDFQFAFQINLGSKDGTGADGLAFVMHNDSRGYSAFGGPGQGLGYGFQIPIPPTTVPIVPSIAIEFDTWYNTEGGTPYTDITNDHATITYGGDIRNIINVEGIVCLSNTCANVEDGADHDVQILWEANTQTLSMTFDGSPRVSYTGDIVNQYLNGTPTVFFGFTGSTGGSSNLQTFDIDSLDIVLVEICGNGVDDDCNGLIDELDSWCKNRCGNIVNANIAVSGDAGANEAPLGWSTGNPSSLTSTTSGSGSVNLGAVSLDDADNLTVFSGESSSYDTGPGTIFSVPNDDGEAQFMVGQETDGILQVVDGLTIGADYRFTFDAAYTWLSGATEPTTAILQLILDPSNANLEDDTPADSHTFAASNTVESLVLEFTATSTEHEVIIYADNLPIDYVWFLELGTGGCGVSRDIVTNFFIPSKMRNN